MIPHEATKIPRAATKIRCGQINKFEKKERRIQNGQEKGERKKQTERQRGPGAGSKAGRHTETLRGTERKREESDASRQREIEIQRGKGQRRGDRER